ELGREPVDLGAVQGLGRLDVEAADDVLGDPVPLLLGLEYVSRHPALLRPGVEHLLEQLRPAQDVSPGLCESVKVGRIPACHAAEGHRGQATRGPAGRSGPAAAGQARTAAASSACLVWRSISSVCMLRGGSPFTVSRDQTPSAPSSQALVLSAKARSSASVSWSLLLGSCTGVTSSTRL